MRSSLALDARVSAPERAARCRTLKARMHWRRFIEAKRYGAEPAWEPDARGGA